jgi:hypothetical protein
MTLTPHSIIHGDACFAYFNKIWGIPKLEIAPTLKLTEHGSLKLTVPLKNTREALKRLAECFKRTR